MYPSHHMNIYFFLIGIRELWKSTEIMMCELPSDVVLSFLTKNSAQHNILKEFFCVLQNLINLFSEFYHSIIVQQPQTAHLTVKPKGKKMCWKIAKDYEGRFLFEDLVILSKKMWSGDLDNQTFKKGMLYSLEKCKYK